MSVHYPSLTKTNKTILIVAVVVFITEAILKASGSTIAPYLGMNIPGLMSGHVYQILAHPFFEMSLMGMLFNGLILWFIGSELEMKWGRSFYLKFISLNVMIPAALFIALSLATGQMGFLFGLAGVNYALLVAYALIYADRPMNFMLLFPMPAKYFCLLLAGINLYSGLLGAGGVMSLTHLSTMIFSFFYLRYLSIKARGLGGGGQRKVRRRSHLSLVEDEQQQDDLSSQPQRPDPNDPKYWQ